MESRRICISSQITGGTNMTRSRLFRFVLSSVFLICILLYRSSHGFQGPPYLNPDLPVDVRVDDLVDRMTLEEKISQTMNNAPAIERLGIPAYDWWNEALHGVG